MVEINNKTIRWQYQIELAKGMVFEIYILTGHLSEVIEKYFLDGKKYGEKSLILGNFSSEWTADIKKNIKIFS